MRSAKIAVTFLIFGIVVFFTAQSAFGGCSIRFGDDNLFTDPQAPGTKYVGPLTVYYDKNDQPDESDDQICWFIRLRKGSDLYQFGKCTQEFDKDNGVFPLNAIEPLQIYFINEVIPNIYQCGEKSPIEEYRECPEAALKSYDQDVSSEDPPIANDSLEYFVMDITIAVQD